MQSNTPMQYEQLICHLEHETALEVFYVLRWLNNLRLTVTGITTEQTENLLESRYFHEVILKIVQSKKKSLQHYLNEYLTDEYEEMEEEIVSYYKNYLLPEEIQAEKALKKYQKEQSNESNAS